MNTFARNAPLYARARPQYPRELFAWLSGLCADHELAWDCATGNGQAAVALAGHFREVVATDVSAEQIAQAPVSASARVVYRVEPAERSSLGAACVDLVTVAQALHWLDHAAFWQEVRRVAKPGAVFAAWGYDRLETDPHVMASLVDPFHALVEPFFAAQNRIMWRGYPAEEVQFPFERIVTPAFAIRVSWTVPELAAYLRTWSAFTKCQADPPVRGAAERLLAAAEAACDPERRYDVSMPLLSLVGRVGSAAP